MKKLSLVVLIISILTGCSIQSKIDGKTTKEWKAEHQKVLTELNLLQDKEVSLEKKRQCQKDGAAFHEREMGGDGFVPRFKYSSKLNTCLYKGGSIGEGSSFRFIRDVYSNEELATHCSHRGESAWEEDLFGGCISGEAFKKISKDLGFPE